MDLSSFTFVACISGILNTRGPGNYLIKMSKTKFKDIQCKRPDRVIPIKYCYAMSCLILLLVTNVYHVVVGDQNF
jgi:hypothetical protein